jgi:flagellar biosynthesis protein FlhG
MPTEQPTQSSNTATQLTYQQGIRVISVTSGKGGVGKSNVVANLAMALALAREEGSDY